MRDGTESRRRFLGRMAGGAAVIAFGGGRAEAHQRGQSASPYPDPAFVPDVELELIASEGAAQLLQGPATRVWQFTGEVLKGDPTAFTMLPGGRIPVIRVKRHQRIRIFFHNELPEETIVHWHGLHLVQKMDGHPMYVIGTGQRYVYEFEVNNRAGTYWFHPHPHQRTGIQVYRGMAGLFIVEDDEEGGVGLPAGEFERCWVLQDRRFDSSNQLVYATHHMDMMMGVTGDTIFVNGQNDFIERVAATAYRVRVLNGSNSRFHKLAWDNGRPLTMIATDGGLLERPVEKPYVMLAPAERVELWLDFTGEPPGTQHVLKSLAFSGGMMGMKGMGGMGRGMRGRGGMRGMGMMGGGTSNGEEFDVLKVRVEREGELARPLPARLSTVPWPRIEDAINRDRPRTIELQMGMGSVSLNGRTFEMDAVAPDEVVRLDTTEVWEFANAFGPMSHPMHLHNLQFKVIGRTPTPRLESVYDTMREGLVDEGLKDTVIVMPGERVRVLMHFTDFTGLYLYHCHILEHEDLGMMRNYRVET